MYINHKDIGDHPHQDVDQASDLDIAAGRSPISVAAAAIYMASQVIFPNSHFISSHLHIWQASRFLLPAIFIWQYMACYMAIYNYMAICLQDDNIWITPDHAIVHGSLVLFYAFYIESICQATKICRQQRTMNIETS